MRNCSDLGVFFSSMPTNSQGQIAIRELSRQSSGRFKPIDVNITSRPTSSPWPPSPRQEKGDFIVGDTPTSPVKGFALATRSWLSPMRGPRR